MTSRRAFLLGFGSALAAPAIVRVESIMPLWVPKPDFRPLYSGFEIIPPLSLEDLIFANNALLSALKKTGIQRIFEA